MKGPRLKFVLGGGVILAALVWLGFVGFQESKAYYITVSEYASMHNRLEGKTVKVAGDVVEGSIDRASGGLRFAISSQGQTLQVRYVGKDVIPDTFKDGSQALVEGVVTPEGVFQARHIEAKCASKYEAEYAKKTK